MLHLLTATNNLDEVVFANRYKSYGAYQIRKQYHVSITRSVFIVLSAFLLIFIISLITNQGKPLKISKPNGDIVNWAETEIEIPVLDIPLQEPSNPATSRASTNESYIITTDKKVVQNNVNTVAVATLSSNSLSNKILGNGFNPLSGLPGSISSTANPSTSAIKIEENMPVFNNGEGELMVYLQNNISYPDRAKSAQVTGRVVVAFDVDVNGNVANIEVEQGIGFGCDEEAVRVVESMPRWKPAIQNGAHKAVRMRLPIAFQLN
jgi:protein TonB